MDKITFRTEPVKSDRAAIREILESTGFFHPFEIDVAIELVDDRLAKGEKSEYFFIFADTGGLPVGYICYGPITVTDHRFDLYWIAVSGRLRGTGIGKQLIREAERHMRAIGGKYVYSETSSRDLYNSTHEFYKKTGYAEVARVPRFYGDDDDKIIFMKEL